MTLTLISSPNHISYFGLVSMSSFQNTLSWSTVGYLCVAIGIVATLLSSYRYLLAYLVTGMLYWLLVEGLQLTIISMFDISSWHGYVAALSLTWFVPSIFFLYRYSSAHPSADTHSYSLSPKPKVRQDNYIEHTPIYKNYKPRFHG